EKRLKEQESQLAQLQRDLDDRCEICADLERQLLEALEQKIEVEAQNATLEERIARLNAVRTLDVSPLPSQESASEVGRLAAEVRARSAQVSALEALVSHLRQAADQRRLLERQHAQALEEVRAARAAAASSSCHAGSGKADAACLDTIQGLESKVRELQKKCELQNVLHEELVLEMAALRRQQTQQRNRGARDAWRAGRSLSAEMTSSSDHTLSLDLSDQLMLDAETSRSSHVRCGARSASPPLLLDDSGLADRIGTGSSLTCSSGESDPAHRCSLLGGAPCPRRQSSFQANGKAPTPPNWQSRPRERANRLCAKASCQNRRRMKRTRKRFNGPERESLALRSLNGQERRRRLTPEYALRAPSFSRCTSGFFALHDVTAQTRWPRRARNCRDERLDWRALTSISIPEKVCVCVSSVNELARGFLDGCVPIGEHRRVVLSQNIRKRPLLRRRVDSLYALRSRTFADRLYQSFSRGIAILTARTHDISCSYRNPTSRSEDLFEFQTTILYGNRDSDDSSASFSYAPDLDALVGADEQHRLPPEDLHRMNDYIDLEDIEEVDEDALSETERENDGMGLGGGGGGGFPVPPPQRLVMERQLIKSVLIGWLPPDVVLGSLEAYHVYVDGVLKATVRAGHRTRALLEGVDSAQVMDAHGLIVENTHSRFTICHLIYVVTYTSSCTVETTISTASQPEPLPSVHRMQNVVEERAPLPHTSQGAGSDSESETEMAALLRRVRSKARLLDARPQVYGRAGCGVCLDVSITALSNRPCVVCGVASSLVADHPLLSSKFAFVTEGAELVQYLEHRTLMNLLKSKHTLGNILILHLQHKSMLHNLCVTECSVPRWQSLNIFCLPASCGVQSVDRVEENHSELSDIVEELEDEMLENGELGHRGNRGSRGSGMSPRKHHHHHHHHHEHTVQGPQMHMHGSSRREKRNSAGQLIIEPDDALSDKEIYPYYRTPSIPAVGMANDSEGGRGIGENYSEEEFSKYDMGPRGAPRGTRGHSGVSTGSQHGGAPLSYQERPRPTSPTPPTRSRHLSDVDDPRGSYSRSAESRSGHRQPRVRWFVALFDYDPQTMSPNPDTADEELPFQEGDLIKIYGGKDQDGFYKGEANGRMGFVPCNMVSEVHMDSDVAETGPPARSKPPPHRGADGDAWAAGGVLPPQPKRMVALYDYDPAELSPNPDPFSELAFSTGDVIYVYGDMDEDGFFFGELHGLRGLVPSNFLTEAPPDYAEGQRRTGQSHGAPMQAKGETRSWPR
ncbi:unnamed protein product, partial [Ixodes hexagonus]